jgi:hypothetical protein
VSDREVPKPCVHANVAAGEVLEPCVRDNVAVGEVPEPCRSTAGGAAGILLTSPCFCRGLRTTDVMDARGEPSLSATEASQMGRRVAELPELFRLKCLSPALEARPHLNGNNPSIPRI